MKKLIFCFSIILLFGCKENPKELDGADLNDEPSSEMSIQTKTSKVEYGNQIIPGERLGTIILNENATSVLDSLGKPDSADAAMGKAVSTWHEDSDNLLSIYTTTQMGIEDFSRIKAIRTLSSAFKTDQDLGVNSTVSEIEKHFRLNKIGLFPFDKKSYALYSTEEGIGFEIGEDQKCHGVVLTEKGTSPDQLYLTFYPDLKKE